MPKQSEMGAKINGAIVFWSTKGNTTEVTLREGWTALEPDYLPGFVPQQRPYDTVLKDALEVAFRDDKEAMVRPLAGAKGWAVVHETRGAEKNKYDTHMTAMPPDDENGTVTTKGGTRDDHNRVNRAFEELKDVLTASQVSGSLVAVLNSLGGVRLRPNGAIYWLPSDLLPRWNKICEVIEKAGKENTCYIVHTIVDKGTLHAIKDAIVAEIEKAAADISAEVGEGKLGSRALTQRIESCKELKGKVGIYEGIIGETLKGLTKALGEAEVAASKAALLAAAEEAKRQKKQAEKASAAA